MSPEPDPFVAAEQRFRFTEEALRETTQRLDDLHHRLDAVGVCHAQAASTMATTSGDQPCTSGGGSVSHFIVGV